MSKAPAKRSVKSTSKAPISAVPSLKNPFAESSEVAFKIPGQHGYEPGLYEATLKMGHDLIQRPKLAA